MSNTINSASPSTPTVASTPASVSQPSSNPVARAWDKAKAYYHTDMGDTNYASDGMASILRRLLVVPMLWSAVKAGGVFVGAMFARDTWEPAVAGSAAGVKKIDE